MKTKKSNMIMLGVLLAMALVLVLTGCKKKGPATANAGPFETSGYEMESVQFEQSDDSFNYLQSEDVEGEEPAEDPNEYPEDEPNEEPGDEPDEPEEEPGDDEPSEDEPEDEPEYPDEDPNAPEDEPNDYPEEDPNESWL